MNPMFFQQAPAETTSYMIFGYALIFGVMFIYLFSLAVRRRNLLATLAMLQELEKQE